MPSWLRFLLTLHLVTCPPKIIPFGSPLALLRRATVDYTITRDSLSRIYPTIPGASILAGIEAALAEAKGGEDSRAIPTPGLGVAEYDRQDFAGGE